MLSGTPEVHGAYFPFVRSPRSVPQEYNLRYCIRYLRTGYRALSEHCEWKSLIFVTRGRVAASYMDAVGRLELPLVRILPAGKEESW